jgi:hypothetical protein
MGFSFGRKSGVEVCSLLPAPLSTSKHLYIYERQPSLPDSQDDFENTQWLDILRPFIAVKNLYVSGQFAPRITLVLHKLVGRNDGSVAQITEYFLGGGPAIRPSEPVHEGIEQSIDARRLSGHCLLRGTDLNLLSDYMSRQMEDTCP